MPERFRSLGRVACALVVSLMASCVPSEPCPITQESLLHPQLPTGAREVVIAPKKQAWQRARGGEEAARPYVRARLTAVPERVLVSKESLPASAPEFARRLAADTWRGLSALTDRENGLPVDNVRVNSDGTGRADVRVGDYTSASNIGMFLADIVAAHELRLLTRSDAVATVRRLLNTLGQLETYRGFLFNFYDTTSLERTSNFISFVDSSWLTAGLMVTRMAFPELNEECTRLIAQTDYRFFYDAAGQRISHGYYVNVGERSPFDYGMLYTEARLGALIAMGKGDVPVDPWFKMLRVFPASCTWQPETPRGVHVQAVRGHDVKAGYMQWGGVAYVPSWGGSMFEALMPTLLVDEMRYTPASLGRNGGAHALVQQRYAAEVLGYPVWGISSSATPGYDGYSEYGVKVLGSRGYGAGAVAPYASALALAAMPDAALANLRALATRYDIYGEYGFYDAVDPLSGTVAYKYLALDQSMLFIALANYLEPHCMQQKFAADPIVQRVLPVIADDNFFD